MEDEDVALRILELYLVHVAPPQVKRKITLDGLLTTYFYLLSKLGKKTEVMESVEKRVEHPETSPEDLLFPRTDTSKPISLSQKDKLF